jgi:hypothetical protein
MPNIEGGQPRDPNSQQPNLVEQGGIPHEKLVASFRTLITEQQEIHKTLRAAGESSREPEELSPARAVRAVLEWYAGSGEREQRDMFFTVRSAWDALAYDQYEPGSREEGGAGAVLQAYYGATREPHIKLTHPMQVRVLDALTEAAGVPHQREQTEIEIPEKVRNYNRYLMSPEYQAKLAEAQAKRRK